MTSSRGTALGIQMDKGTTNDLAASRSPVPSPDEMRGAALILSMAAWNTDTRISEGAQYQAWEPGSVPDTVAVTLMVGLRPSAEGPQSRGWPQCAKSRPMLSDSTPHRGDFRGEK
jgi:hypothetical protein